MKTFFHLTRKLVHEIFTLVGHAAVFAAVCANWLGKEESQKAGKASQKPCGSDAGIYGGRFADLFTRLLLIISISLSVATVCICLKKDSRG